LSKSVLEMIRKERQPILIEDVECRTNAFSGSEKSQDFRLRPPCARPWWGKRRLFGILYVGQSGSALWLSRRKSSMFLALVAAQAGAAIDNAVAHEKIAQQSLQRSALNAFLR